jgi:LPS-assembly lipoprotein
MMSPALSRICRIALAMAIASAVAGCFQPLYSDRSVSATGSNITTAMAGVDIMQIPAANGTAEARLAVEIRNSLLFGLTGGNVPSVPTHQLRINLASQRLSVIVDVTTARPDNEIYGLNASFSLVDLRTGKTVLTDTTFSRVSYDIPGQQQRFARARGLRDAETRAAQVIAENIRNRLASYFTAGT